MSKNLEKIRKRRKKSLGPVVDSIVEWTIWDLYKLLGKNKIYSDASYQRPACWNRERKVSYIFNLLVGGIKSPFYFSDVESCAEACHEKWKEEDSDYQYYVNLEEKYKYLSLDGNNRSCAIKEFFTGSLTLRDCELRDPSGLVASHQIDSTREVKFEELPCEWQNKFKQIKVPVCVVKAATVSDLHFEFAKLNSIEALNHQELRNSIRSKMADEVREMAQEPIMNVAGKIHSGEFWKDFEEVFTQADIKRRKSDEFYARLLLLTYLHRKKFKNQISLMHASLDEAYHDNSPKRKDLDLCKKLCQTDMEMAKVTKGSGCKPTKKLVVNLHLFQLALKDEGLYIDTSDSEFQTLVNELDNHETLRKTEWYVIPPTIKQKQATCSDKEWGKIKNDYSYEHWMETANQSADNSLRPRFEAAEKSVEILVKDPRFQKVFKALPTPRKNFGLKVKETLAISQNWCCALTGRTFDKRQLRDAQVVADHWVPLDGGGSNDLSNIRIMFAGANASKSTDHLKEISYEDSEENEQLIEDLKNNKCSNLSDGFTAIIAAVQKSTGIDVLLVPDDKAGKYMQIIHNISI
tara:strand:+ start:134 stop:1864 length:1731 start_codon:yes stop_codon:yes gene_type:complete